MSQDPAMSAEATARREHASAVLALGQAGHAGLQQALQDLRTLLLSTDARALRRSVGWWGRLIGRDIQLDAESKALRERSGVLLHHATAAAEQLRDQHAVLGTQAARLREACNALQAEEDTLRLTVTQADDGGVAERRIAHLAALRLACTLTMAQLDLVAANALAIAERHAQQLPRLAMLFEQQRGLQAGKQNALRLSSVQDTLDQLQASLDATPQPATPATIPTAPSAKEHP